MRPAFCQAHRRRAARNSAVMRIERRPGQEMQIYWQRCIAHLECDMATRRRKASEHTPGWCKPGALPHAKN